MTKGKARSSVFTNFIISYIITLLIPLFVMSFLVLYNFVNALRNEVEANITTPFIKSVEQFDLQVEQLQKTALQIELNTVFRMANIDEQPYNFIDIKNEISKYKNNSFVDEIFIYHYNADYISSVNYSYKLKDFNRIFIPAVNIEESFSKFMKSDQNTTLLYFSKSEINMNFQDNLMYLCKIPVYGAGHYAFVIYLIPQSSLKNILSPAMITKDTYVFIKDPESSKILFSFSEDKNMESLAEMKKALGPVQGKDTRKLKVNQRSFSVYSYKSGKANLDIIQLVPNDFLSRKINNIRTVYMIGMVVIILLSGLIISILMKINYRPIKNLRKRMEETLSTRYTIKNRLNEIEDFEYAFLQYNKENSTLQETVKNNNSIAQQYLLDCFLSGQARETDRIRETCELAGLYFNQKQYCILLLKVCRTEYENKVKSIERSLQNPLDSGIIQYFIKKDIATKKIVIFLGSPTGCEKTSREYAYKIMEHLKTEYDDNPRVGIGSYVEDIFDIYKSYQEALKVLDYNYTLSKSYITSISELSQIDEMKMKYPFELFDNLKASIHKKNALEAEAAINKILLFIKSENLTLHWSKNLCYDIVNTIYKEVLLSNNQSVLLKKPYIEKIYGTEVNTFEDIENTMSVIINDLTGYLSFGEGTYELKLLQQIIYTIRENYTDPDFGLQSLADSIQMSPPYLSQYFKKNTNYTIYEYIAKLRMEKAKELLTKTQTSVNDIAIQVGYYSVSSFIRKFREVEDLTPGQYKKKYES